MRIKTLRLKRYERNERLRDLGWHTWFAWYPVNVDGYIVWLRKVKRDRCNYRRGWEWDYEEVEDE